MEELPPDVARRLRDHRHDLPALRGYVRLLREAGWTLEAIGVPLDAPRSTVSSWERHPHHVPLLNFPVPPSPPSRSSPRYAPVSPPPNLHTRALPVDVPPDDAARIADLAPLARRCRGGTPPTSPLRAAADELDALVLRHRDRGVPVQRLADLAGVTYRAMKVRLDRASHPHSHS
jgi:hypothetical protein